MTPPAPASTRSTDLGLARLHLRLGSLAIARAELETLAGRDALDDDGLLDLAEVRWRTGDIVGAGEAADAILREADGHGPLLAFVIAAESSMARGRPTEARRLAGQVLAADRAAVDRLFAGMPRSAIWPADPVALPPSGMTMFDPATLGAGAAAGLVDGAADAGLGPAPDAVPPPTTAAAAGSIGLWDGDAEAPDGASREAAADPEPEADLPPAGQALADGRTAIVDGRFDEAALRLGLALRLDPTLAEAVLELVADARAPDLAMMRGDAYRLLGREAEARRAYAEAIQPAVPADVADPADAAHAASEADDSNDTTQTTDTQPSEGDPA